MADKRSLGEALLTPEKLAFIQGEGTVSANAHAPSGNIHRPRRGRRPKAKTVDIELGGESPAIESAPRIRRPRERHEAVSALPNANEVLDEVLVPLTTRIPHRLVQSLRRVCLERRLQHQTPDSIQEIVEEAIGDWLSRQA